MCWNHPSVLGVMRPAVAAVMAAAVDVTRASVTAVVIVAIVVVSVTLRPQLPMDSKQENDPGFKLGQ